MAGPLTVQKLKSPPAGIRVAFWLSGMLLGIFLAYTNRHFLNTDGLTFIEMGEGLRHGEWDKLVNLACSPLFAVMLGAAQALFNTNPSSELPILKVVSLLNLGLAMAACDLFMRFVATELEARVSGPKKPIAAGICVLVYAAFLVAALVWIKVRLVNPDMLVFGLILLSMTIVLWARMDPERYVPHLLLGVVGGVGYLTKTYLFVYAGVFFVLAGVASWPFRRAVPRVLAGVAAMLVVSSVLIVPLSVRLGRLSIGEAGSLAYTAAVAAQGTPIHQPERLHDNPTVLLYHYPAVCTDAMGFDIAYWSLGLKGHVTVGTQLKTLAKNIGEAAVSCWWLLIAVVLWLGYLRTKGLVSFPRLWPPELWHFLLVPGVCGIGLFAMIHLETRYIAPFVFLVVTGILLYPRYALPVSGMSREIGYSIGMVLVFVLAMVGHSAVDQVTRGLVSADKRSSFQDAFDRSLRIKEFFQAHGIPPGSQVCVVGHPEIYWARIARVRISARISDEASFFTSSASDRASAVRALGKAGITAAVGKGQGFARFNDEGWVRIPGTGDYFARLLHSGPGYPR